MHQTVGEHLFWTAILEGNLKAGGIEAGSGKYLLQVLAVRQVGHCRDDLQSPPLDHQLGCKHHRIGSRTQRDVATAREKESEVCTRQKPMTRATPGPLDFGSVPGPLSPDSKKTQGDGLGKEQVQWNVGLEWQRRARKHGPP
jgi:hypothetical protein